MPNREVILEMNSEQVNLARIGVSDASAAATIKVAGDTLAPDSPLLDSANTIPDGVKLEFTLPSINADGTPCVDLRWAKIYWGTSTGTYTGNAVIAASAGTNGVYVDTNIGTTTEKFYVVTAIDNSGNESAVSNELSGTGGGADPNTDIPTDADTWVFDDSYDSDGVGVGNGIIGIVFRIPQSTWLNFDRYRLWYDYNDGGGFTGSWTEIEPINRTAYLHKGLNTSYYYKYRASIVAADGTESTSYDYAINGGTGYIPNEANNSIFDGTVLVGNLVAANEVRGEHFFAESYLAINDDTFGNDGIQLEYNGGDPRMYVGDGSNEYLQFDGTNLTWNTANTSLDSSGNLLVNAKVSILDATWQNKGIQLDYNSGTPRFYVGNGDRDPATDERFIMYDGTNLSWQGVNTSLTAAGAFTASNATITGAITATSGAIGGFTLNASHLYTGSKTAYNDSNAGVHLGTDGIGFGDNVFTVSAAGAMVATSANITGVITANTGYIGGTSGWTIASGKMTASGIGMATTTGDATYAFWAGSDSPASAEFSVTHAGVLSATGATIVNTTISGTSTWTGSSIPTTYTAAKCTDANADQTSVNTANDVSYVAGVQSNIIGGWRYGSTTYINGGDIYTNTITATQINVSNLSALSADLGSITSGNITVDSSSWIKGGASGYNSGTGFWLGYSSGYKFFIGNSSGNKMLWTGSALEITGKITASTGSNIPWSYISAVSIDADDITTGTLTGLSIRTAASGARAILDSGDMFSSHTFSIYDSSRNRVFIGAGGFQLTDSSGVVTAVIVDSPTSLYDCIALFKQDSTSGAKPVLALDQDDTSEGFINFVGYNYGSIVYDSACDASVRVELNGTKYYIPLIAA